MTNKHLSCGGVVYRIAQDKIEVLLLHRFAKDTWPYDSLHLPKGTKLPGETNMVLNFGFRN